MLWGREGAQGEREAGITCFGRAAQPVWELQGSAGSVAGGTLLPGQRGAGNNLTGKGTAGESKQKPGREYGW